MTCKSCAFYLRGYCEGDYSVGRGVWCTLHVEEREEGEGKMSEIAKCPICCKDVKKSIWRLEYEGCAGSVVITVKCCGMEASTVELWNRYAAAMELAKVEVAFDNCDPEDEYKYQDIVEWKRQRVLEVFNEQATEVDKSKNIMVYLNGKDKPVFRCHCGCNVFHHPTDISEEESRQTYICNACDTRYIGE